jgi:TrmH family RNA methyltransferase
MKLITSKDNPRLKTIRRLAQDSQAYRKLGLVWLEGDHLCRAALARGVKPELAIFSESIWQASEFEWMQCASEVWTVPDELFGGLSGLESPAKMGFLLTLPQPPELDPQAPTVVLDRLQDAGNVGAILRSASAFGFKQVVAIKGTAGLWSPKVLRAGMGAHFGMRLIESASLEDLQSLKVPLLGTDVHEGPFLHELVQRGHLPQLCAWVMGHEGQGISPELMAIVQQKVRIAQPGGEESLNVATAAAICLHASATIEKITAFTLG